MIRTYKYRAFRPDSGIEAFDTAVYLKRRMWADLCEMERDLAQRRAPLLAVPKAERDMDALAALRKERTDRIKSIRQSFAAQGLAWGDYNSVVFQFDGAVRASAKRKALPEADDAALGDCIVAQIMNGSRPHHLLSRNDVCLEYLEPNAREAGRKPGGRRAGYRRARLTFRIRSDRNPAGPAEMTIDFVMSRPIPVTASIVEVRVIRTKKRMVNKDGVIRDIDCWAVTFAIKVDVPEVAADPSRAVGVALTWAGADEDGAPLAVLSGPGGMKTVGYNGQNREAWEAWRELRDRAEEMNDDALRVEVENKQRKLFASRKIYLRTLAKEVVSGASAVAVDDTFLSGMGVKHFTAPATFRLEIQRAAENAGCRFFRIKVTEKDARKRAALLKNLAREEL